MQQRPELFPNFFCYVGITQMFPKFFVITSDKFDEACILQAGCSHISGQNRGIFTP